MHRLLHLPYFLLIPVFSYSQDSSTIQAKATSNAVAFYNKYIGENSALYNGSEYVAYDFHIQGHQYFEWSTPQTATINYNGILYASAPITYDIVRDEVITTTYNDNVRIKLVSEKISYFYFQNHFFVRLIQDSANKSITATGFYERLYDGDIKLFAKRKKTIQEVISTSEGDRQWFKQSDEFFVKRNNSYSSIANKADLFALFGKKSKDVKKYLRKNKIKFKRQPELTILSAIKYYDQLKN